MINSPVVKLGIVAVSRDCFISDLSLRRRIAVAEACKAQGISIYECSILVESETDAMKALDELRINDVNALVVYLGNFGPEGPESYICQVFGGPVMVAAAAEETGKNLMDGRGDAYCGVLNFSYNLGLRNAKAYIPEMPVGTSDEIAQNVLGFIPIARAMLALKRLKIISFGPRPYDFLACNAPIKPFYDLGVTVMENSELDLYAEYLKHNDDPRIDDVAEDMIKELGKGNKHSGILRKLAQYELTLTDFYENNLGYCKYAVFANKCWPAFQTTFGFVPCYVNSRLAARGIPVACETDLYGALSEFIIQLVSELPATLLDINNTVPYDMIDENEIKPYSKHDLFMGFHCGNTASCMLKSAQMEHQLIMKRNLEPNTDPDITRGTLEGQLRPGEVTLFRLQSTADGHLRSYIAEGDILDINPKSFGAIGVLAIPEMARFYRHVLIQKQYPHHAGVAFKHVGHALYEIMKYLGINDIAYNQPKNLPYPTENPFK